MEIFDKSTYAKIIFSLDDINDPYSFSFYHYDSRPDNRPIIISDIIEFKSWIAKLNPSLKLFLVIHIGAEEYTQKKEKKFASKYPCESFIASLKDYFPNIKYVLASRDPKPEDKTHFKLKVWKSDDVLDLNKNHPSQSIQDLFPEKKTSIPTKTSILKKIEMVDFAILTALLKDEYSTFKKHMVGEKTNGFFSGLFKESKEYDFSRSKIALVSQNKMGMVDASLSTIKIYRNINPKVIILSGVCGGRKNKVKLYDIIIPEAIIDIITGKLESNVFVPYGYSETINEDLIKYLKEITDDDSFIKEQMLRLVPLDKKFNREREIVQKICIYYDVMACGSFVLKTKNFLEGKSKEMNDKIIGFEMESYGIMRATNLFCDKDKLSLIIKSVMDYTDNKKSDKKDKTIKSADEPDYDNIPDGEDIKNMASYMSYICTRALLPHIDRFINDQKVK